MEKDNNTQFTELHNLLREHSSEVPPCDLEHGFLQDLHHRISSEENAPSFWATLRHKYGSLSSPTIGWAGGALAALALVVGVGFLSQPTGDAETFADLSIGNYDLVNSYKHIDLAGNIPAFTEESYDF